MLLDHHEHERAALWREAIFQQRLKIGICVSIAAGILHLSFTTGNVLLPLLTLPPLLPWMRHCFRRHQSCAAMAEAFRLLADIEKTAEADILRRQAKKRRRIGMSRCVKGIMLSTMLLWTASVVQGDDIRVVSLSPSLTELVFQLGKGDRLVGRSSACDYPPEVEKLPVAGAFGVPTIEKMLTLKATLVISSALKDKSTVDAVEQLGIKFLFLPAESIDEYRTSVTTLGAALGCEDKAKEEIARFDTCLKIIGEESPPTDRHKPLVYWEIWDNPPTTIGAKSFINDLIRRAGGRNIAESVDKGYFTCSWEWVLTSKPELIICPAMGKERMSDLEGRVGWKELPAAAAGRVYTQLDESLFYRLGPRTTEGMKILKSIIADTERKSP